MSDVIVRPEAPVDVDPGLRIQPVLLSGGAGTRLWPMSRKHYPKQLLSLLSDRSVLQETAARTQGMDGVAAPIVVCHQEHRFFIAEQLREIGITPRRILLEPVSRNTAAALVATAVLLEAETPGAVMLVQPTDHHVADLAAFQAAMSRAMGAARAGWLTTFGITPRRPETGYGYIERADALADTDGVFTAHRFIEKPQLPAATRMAESGVHYWNSGMFLLPAGPFLDEVRKLQPDLLDACRRAVEQGRTDLDFFRFDEAAFATAPSLSVDKAIMEHSDRVAVLPVEIRWRDIGSWASLHEALAELGPADAAGNVLKGDVEMDDVSNCYIDADGRMVAAVGLRDLTVVVTDDVVLVADSAQASRVSGIVERLGRRNRQEVLEHPKVYRPWGSYQSVDMGERFQVKRIIVNPGAELSLQMHHHRAEHWVVVRGTARVHCDGQERLLQENQSTYIPLGATHRLANPGLVPLHMIEVQSGAYLGEDDIVRFEDSYGRS